MFEKSKLKSEIKQCKAKIEEIEKKRYRSQAALVEAILVNKSPDDSDVDYFNKYTEEIDRERERLKDLTFRLEHGDK